MDTVVPPNAPLKSALFVDFDNIYIGLTKTDPLAAERFASDPARWLAWLEKGRPGIPGETSSATPAARSRSILIRRCYPNPDAGFRRYRSFFTSSAFSVIDCPSLTRTGKNSSDIYMVMDILDTLNHKTYFDEFIIFSGDSDFMPVLLRLRAHDRRTTTLAIDFMPPAFKAACDLVISEEEFIEDALGVSPENNGGLAHARLELPVLKDMAQRVFDMVRQEGEVVGAELPDILKDFREFRESTNWLGFGTSQRLAEALAHHEPRLSLVRVNPMQYKLAALRPAGGMGRVASVPGGNLPGVEAAHSEIAVEEPSASPAAGSAPAEGYAPAGEGEVDADLRQQITAAVREVVRSSENAVLLARASQYVVNKVGPRVLESQWAGTGSFKKLLLSIDDLGLEITSQPEPGYIFDPRRHVHPSQRGARRTTDHREADGRAEKYAAQRAPYAQEEELCEEEPVPSLAEFARRVSQVTGAPLLTQEQYALAVNGIYAELQKIADGQKTYNTYQSAKSVSDWCAEQGRPVSHSDIVLLFKGIIFQEGIRFGKYPGSFSPHELARVIRDNILALCERSRLELSEEGCQMLDDWIMGGFDASPLEASETEPSHE